MTGMEVVGGKQELSGLHQPRIPALGITWLPNALGKPVPEHAWERGPGLPLRPREVVCWSPTDFSLCDGGNYSLLSPSAQSSQHTQALPTSQQVARAQSCSLVISYLHLSSPQAVRAILTKCKPDQVPPLLPTTLRRCCPCNALHSLTSQLHTSGLLSPWLILSQPYWLSSSLLKGVRHALASGLLHWLLPLPGPLHPRSPHRPHSHLLQVLTQCRLSIASSLTHLT